MKLIFFDGYIRNCDDLCRELNIDRSYSEKEQNQLIIMRGYEQWGCSLPKYLKGYFAFCLYNDENQSYFGARDRFGVIPFFYHELIGTEEFRCGTCINGLIKKTEKKEFDESALNDYMTFSYIPGEKTAFTNIKKLMPGFYLTATDESIMVECYWEPTYDIKLNQDEFFWENELLKMIKNSIYRDCNHNKKDAFLLSAGLDSNYLFANAEIENAYTIGFKGYECNESEIAEENGNRLGRKVKKIYITPDLFFENVRLALSTLEQPLATAASVAFMIGCKSVSEEVDVLYTGEGADELFAGYDVYYDSELYSEDVEYMGKANIFSEKEKKRYMLHYVEKNPTEIVRKYAPRKAGMTNLQYMLYVDRKMWLEGNSFLNSYKMSRMCGIELRMPMVDEDIFELINTVPDKYIIDDHKNKILLRKIATRNLPSYIVERPKKGFVTPIRYWLADSNYNLDVQRAFNSEIAHMFFDRYELEKLFNEYCSGNYDLWRKVWLIYTFIVWYEVQFI